MKLLALIVCVISTIAFAVDKEPIPEDAVGYDFETGWIYKLKDLPETQIYRGTRSVAGEFLPLSWISNCTATAVAPNVVFTASHCVTTGKRINVQHRGSGRSYPATCTRHPRYNTRTIYNDWAFCKLDASFPADSVLASFAKEKPAIGAKILLNGYGAPNVGTHYWGTTSVKRYENQDMVTCGPSTLGGGDSGGPVFLWTDDRSGASGFEIVAVNSRGNGTCDFLNYIAHNEFQTWAREYERDKNVSLCGISADCRGEPEPEPDCDRLYQELGACYSRDNGTGFPMPAGCQEAYRLFGSCVTEDLIGADPSAE